MKMLETLVNKHQADIRPASLASIKELQEKIGFSISKEYQSFLLKFGVIVFGAYETYGLGVPDNYYLNVANILEDLSKDPNYPENSLPVLEVGDGHYYLYDNKKQRILLWATPNGGTIKTFDESLESFLINHIFK